MTIDKYFDINEHPELLTKLRYKNKIRLGFSLIVWLLYGSLALAYGPLQGLFAKRLSGDSSISFVLLYFFTLLLVFIGLEYLYLRICEKLRQPAAQAISAIQSEKAKHDAD